MFNSTWSRTNDDVDKISNVVSRESAMTIMYHLILIVSLQTIEILKCFVRENLTGKLKLKHGNTN